MEDYPLLRGDCGTVGISCGMVSVEKCVFGDAEKFMETVYE